VCHIIASRVRNAHVSSNSTWRHWGCVTPKIISNVKKSFEEASELDGYDDLNPEDQARVIKAYQEGHVADEDIPESARKPADEEGEEKPKKAGRKKKADDDEGEAAEKPKKARASSSKVCTTLLILTLTDLYTVEEGR